MPFLTAAVVLVGAVGLLNLVLSMGIIRRLREQAASSPGALVPHLPAPGEQVGDFTAATTAGATITRGGLRDDTVVGFFSPDCGPCRHAVPQFVAYAAGMPEGRDRALAVVAGDGTDAADMIAELVPVARVVTAPEAGAVETAFRTNGYPSIYLVGRDGVVVACGHSMEALPTPPAAPLATSRAGHL